MQNANSSKSERFNDTFDLKRYWFITALVVVMLSLVFNFMNGAFGSYGGDSDDLLRFVQIRDYLNGQSWFDTNQYRMGLTAAGTDMHWSRLPDIPIICLTHFFNIFTSQDMALKAAIFVWPPLSGLIVFMAFAIGAEQIEFDGNRKYLRSFTYIVVSIFLLTYYRFKSGAIDHHNIQFGFIALAAFLAMDRQDRVWRYFLSGVACALAVSIGPEIYLFVAVICAYIAMNWAVRGQVIARATQAFGLGLASAMLALFVLTIPASQYMVVYCDALSLITLTAAGLGGLGMIGTVKFGQVSGLDATFIRRFMLLVGLAIICVIGLSFQGPQCLANPLKALPQDVKELWLDSVLEAKPIYKLNENWPMLLPMILGPILFGLCVFFIVFKAQFKASAHIKDLWGSHVLLFSLLVTAFLLTLYQIRFSPFAYVFAVMPMAVWVAKTYQKGLEAGGTNIKYIFFLALTIQSVWMLPGVPFVPDESSNNSRNAIDLEQDNKTDSKNDDEDDQNNCVSDSIMEALNEVPEGLISAFSNYTGMILIKTPHRVVSGNYHRNWEGISTQIKISISEPKVAYQSLSKHKINYLYYCPEKRIEAPEKVELSKTGAPAGLIKHIDAGQVPSYLTPVFDAPLNENGAMLYKVVLKTP